MSKSEVVVHAEGPASDMELLLVQIGKRKFALPLADVKHIVPLPFDFAYSGKDAADYYAFEGEPLKFISGWEVMGEESVYKEFAELQPMLPVRRQDHIEWMDALNQSIRGGDAFTKAKDPHDCAFGKWYYGYRAKDPRLAMVLSGFEQPHAHIHALADRLLTLAESGKREEAITRFEEAKSTTLANLLDIFSNTDHLLGSLQRRIAIILEDEGINCALGADMVLDITSVAGNKLTRELRNGKFLPRLAMLSDEEIVPFFQWAEALQAIELSGKDAAAADEPLAEGAVAGA